MEPLQKEIWNNATYISEISARSLQSGSPSWGLQLYIIYVSSSSCFDFSMFFIEVQALLSRFKGQNGFDLWTSLRRSDFYGWIS